MPKRRRLNNPRLEPRRRRWRARLDSEIDQLFLDSAPPLSAQVPFFFSEEAIAAENEAADEEADEPPSKRQRTSSPSPSVERSSVDDSKPDVDTTPPASGARKCMVTRTYALDTVELYLRSCPREDQLNFRTQVNRLVSSMTPLPSPSVHDRLGIPRKGRLAGRLSLPQSRTIV